MGKHATELLRFAGFEETRKGFRAREEKEFRSQEIERLLEARGYVETADGCYGSWIAPKDDEPKDDEAKA
jgi:hypothetical protein